MAMEEKDARQWAMFCHLSSLTGFIIPLASIIVPIVLWQIKKNESPFVDDQGKEAVNFQITLFIASIISLILCFVGIGFVLLAVLAIAWLILTIIAGIKANDGVPYRYPFTLRLIK